MSHPLALPIELEKAALKDKCFTKRKLYPSVDSSVLDFPSRRNSLFWIIYNAVRFLTDMYSVLFGMLD